MSTVACIGPGKAVSSGVGDPSTFGNLGSWNDIILEDSAKIKKKKKNALIVENSVGVKGSKQRAKGA